MGAKFSLLQSEGKRGAGNFSRICRGLQIFEGFPDRWGKTETTTGWSNEAPPEQKVKFK
jgi:hypothetical protein